MNSIVTNNSKGITINGDVNSIIKYNRITYNSNLGLEISGSGITIEGNEINYNDKAISSNKFCDSRIINNTILFNNGNGISIRAGSGDRIFNITLSGNIINFNSDTGIYLSVHKSFLLNPNVQTSSIHDITIKDNTVHSNDGIGIQLKSSIHVKASYDNNYAPAESYIWNITIKNNTVYSNKGTGISLSSTSTSDSTYNTCYSHSYLYNISINKNMVNSNEGAGIDLSSSASNSKYKGSCRTYIYNINMTSNTIHLNQGAGISVRPFSDSSSSLLSSSYIGDIIITDNNVSSNKETGINFSLYSFSQFASSFSRVYHANITNNNVSSNGGNGISISSWASRIHGVDASISSTYENINIINNTVSTNEGAGINIGSKEYCSSIHNIKIKNNTISLSEGDGICLYSYYFIYNIILTSNTISSNQGVGIRNDAATSHNIGVEIDLTLNDNNIYSNDQAINVKGSNATITNNSIAYNTREGVLFEDSTDNEIHFNDIYSNDYGVKVSGGATVDAEKNYWGDSSGPYHESLNPDGKGNAVNGDGTELDFIPFLSSSVSGINERPVAVINADATNVGVDEDVTFLGGDSSDDSRVDKYFFDYGDGKNSSWTTLTTVVHKYSTSGEYNVILTVLDDYGVKNNNTATITIKVLNPKPIAEIISITPNPAKEGEAVTFIGNGTDDGTVVGYNWRSSNDNELSTEASFTTPSLSPGTYVIYFKVQDNLGEWSDEVSIELVVKHSGSLPDDGDDKEGDEEDDGGFLPGFDIITFAAALTIALVTCFRKKHISQ